MSLLQQTLGQGKLSMPHAITSRLKKDDSRVHLSQSRVVIDDLNTRNQERSMDEAEESLGLQNIRFGMTYKSGNTGTNYNSSFGSSTMNKTNFQPI